MDVYPIHFGTETVGTATAERQGLYYRIECSCERKKKEPYRIYVRCGEHTTDLGICIPDGNKFSLHTRKSVRQIGEGDMLFLCDPDQNHPNANFYPIEPDKPFLQLSRLQSATLEYRDGIIGLCFTGRSPAPQGSDPIREPGNK